MSMKNKLIKILLTISFIILVITITIIGFFEQKKMNTIEEGFNLKGDREVVIEYGNNYEENGYTALIDGINKTDEVEVINNVDITKVGTYEIKYILRYKNYNKTLTRTVKVVDTEAPKLTLSEKEIYCTVNDKCDNITYKVTDNYDTDLSTKVTKTSNINMSKKGNYEVKYMVEDSSGNEAQETLKVHVTDKFDHTYVEVKISTQKLVYYVKKKPVLTTDVTTGKNGATKLGNFKILRKTKNQWLVTKKYKSFVKYWMAYDGRSFGLHDASWRKKFGGQIYKTNGSHGCVNLPTKAAEKLFSMIEVGTPVYIKR